MVAVAALVALLRLLAATIAARSLALCVLRRSRKIEPRSMPSAAQPMIRVISPAAMIATLARSSPAKRRNNGVKFSISKASVRDRRGTNDRRRRIGHERQRIKEAAGSVVAHGHDEYVWVAG